ncbi:MAG: hypothetical protein AAFN50_12250 [Pseudomonadota bacterium]
MKRALAFAFLLIAACGGPASAPEVEVREWLAVAQVKAEAKERRALVDMIAPGYLDSRGYRRDDIETMLRVYFLRQHNVSLVTKIDDVRVFGDSAAEVDMTVGMAGTNDGVLGFSANAYRFELELERDGDDWQLIAARWGDLVGELE